MNFSDVSGDFYYAAAIRRENDSNLWDDPKEKKRSQIKQEFLAKMGVVSQKDKVRKEFLSKVGGIVETKKEISAESVAKQKPSKNVAAARSEMLKKFAAASVPSQQSNDVKRVLNPYYGSQDYHKSSHGAGSGADGTSMIDVGAAVWVLDSQTNVWKEATIEGHEGSDGYMVSFARVGNKPRSPIFIPRASTQMIEAHMQHEEVPPAAKYDHEVETMDMYRRDSPRKRNEEAGAAVSPVSNLANQGDTKYTGEISEEIMAFLQSIGLDRKPYSETIASSFTSVEQIRYNYSYAIPKNVEEFQMDMKIDRYMSARGILKQAADFYRTNSVAGATTSMHQHELHRLGAAVDKFLISRDPSLLTAHGDMKYSTAKSIDYAFRNGRITGKQGECLYRLLHARDKQEQDWNRYAKVPTVTLSSLVREDLDALGISRSEISTRPFFLTN